MAVTSKQIIDFLLANPGLTDAQIAATMQEYKVTPAQMAAAVNVPVEAIQERYIAAAPNTETAEYKAAVQNQLQNQILSQGTTSQWQGEGKGSAEANAADMAKILADAGITDISQFGKVTKAVDVQVIPQIETVVVGYDNEYNQIVENKIVGYTDQKGNAVDPSLVKTDYVYEGEGGGQTVYIAPVGTETTFGNKLTGQAVADTYGERQTGDAFGGTFDGKGNTGYRVEFDAQGKPLFYTTSASSSDVPSWVKPALILGGAYFGLDAAGLLGGLGGSAAAGLTAAEAAGLGLTAAEASALGLSAAEFAAAAGTAGTVAGTVAGMGTGTGLTAGASGLGINAAGTAGLGSLGTGAGITAGTGLTGTGVLTGSTLGTGLLGTGAGLAGLTGTGVLSGSTLGTNLLGTTGTGALTGTGVLTGSNLGTQLLGTGAGTAATVGGVTGLTNAANVGLGALNTGVTTGLTGLGTGALNTGVNVTGATTGVTTGATNVANTAATNVANTAATNVANTAATNVANTASTTLTATELANAAKLGLTAAQYAQLFSSTAQTAAGLLQQQTSKEAAQKAQAMIDAETAAAKQSAAFRPIGMTTRFGASQFGFDPKTGQLTSAGYTLSPAAKAAQDRFVKLAEQGIQQAEGAQKAFEPLQTGAQSLFTLGNKYLAQTPESVAENYLKSQMALLQPGRELELANLQNRLQQQGRGGLSVAQGGTMGATTPELQALFNARAQQEAQLAANAQQYGQQNVLFGAGLLGQGATAMGNYYGGQQQAYAPYTTALGQVQGLETAAQQPLMLGANLGQTAAQAGFNVGQLGLRGAGASVELATGKAATTNPYSTAISGLAANPAFGQYVGGLLSPTAPVTAMSAPATTFGTGNYYGQQDLGLYL